MPFLDENNQYLRPGPGQAPLVQQQQTPGDEETAPGGDKKTPSRSPYGTLIPGSALYEQAKLLASTAYKNALAKINRKRQSTVSQYGYKSDVDPESGVIRNMQVDPFNQYGFYQKQRRDFATQADQLEEHTIGRNLGRGGLASQMQGDLRYQFGEGSAQLGRGLTDTLAGLQEDQSEASYQRDRQMWEAELIALRAAIEAAMFNPAGGGYGSDEPRTKKEKPATVAAINAVNSAMAQNVAAKLGAGYGTTMPWTAGL